MTSRGPAYRFDDADAYERFMGAWSRAAAEAFLAWLSCEAALRWLDVGCGTGIFTQAVLRCACPATVDAIDPAAAQVQRAARTIAGARFAIADAQSLPFGEDAFDVVASALALNFITDRSKAVREMHRVARSGATVAAFVWDFAGERSPSWPLRRGLRTVGVRVPEVPGTRESALASLQALFVQAGLENITTRQFDVTVRYANFEAFWTAQTPRGSPTTAAIDTLTERERTRLMGSTRDVLPIVGSGAVAYAARANAVTAVAAEH